MKRMETEETIFIHLSPKRRYTINLEIKSRKRAEPRIVDLDWKEKDKLQDTTLYASLRR